MNSAIQGSINGATVVAGVAGEPVTHSLSPRIQNLWIAAAGLNGVYVPFSPTRETFPGFVHGLRGGAIRGLNITAPFKELALHLADQASGRATLAGAANLLIFEVDGRIIADNTDGEGLLAAFAEQAPSFDAGAGPVAIIGAGGAARGAAAALLQAGAREVIIIGRTVSRAESLAEVLGKGVRAQALDDAGAGLKDAVALINATPAGRGGAAPPVDITSMADRAVVMDMVYSPLRTQLLTLARARGLGTVDGLAMLIGQARPSFAAFFGEQPPPMDVRAALIAQGAVEGEPGPSQ